MPGRLVFLRGAHPGGPVVVLSAEEEHPGSRFGAPGVDCTLPP